MAAHGMIHRTRTQTSHDRSKKNPKDHDVRCLHRGVTATVEEVKEDADEEEEEAAEEVRMDVDGFVVQVEERLQALGQGVGRGRAVGCEDVGVVLVPGGEGMVGEEERARGWGGSEEFACQVAGGDGGGDGAVWEVTAADGRGHLILMFCGLHPQLIVDGEACGPGWEKQLVWLRTWRLRVEGQKQERRLEVQKDRSLGEPLFMKPLLDR